MKKKVVVLIVLAVFMVGCQGPFVPVQSIDKVGIATVMAASNIKVVSDEEASTMTLVGEFKGYSCQNRALVSEPESTKAGAVDQLRISAAQNGATAVGEPACKNGGLSFTKNCWNYWECIADAYK